MKKDQLTYTNKGIENNPIYKTEVYSAYQKDLLAIVKAHYVYSTYINYWGNIFTTGELRPELQIDYSSILATCFGFPEELASVRAILKQNYPSDGWNLPFNSELAINEIRIFFLENKDWDGNITFTHEAVRELIISICAVSTLSDGMEIKHFRDSEPVFEQTSVLAHSFHIDPIYDIIIKVLGGSKDNDHHTTSMMAVYTSNIFDYPDTKKKGDEYIAYLMRVFSTYKEKILLRTY